MNGIGPEVIIKALANSKMTDYFIPIIYGSSKIMSYHKNIVNNPNFSYVSIRHADNAAHNKVNVLNVWEDNINITLGQASEESGKIAFKAMEKAKRSNTLTHQNFALDFCLSQVMNFSNLIDSNPHKDLIFYYY